MHGDLPLVGKAFRAKVVGQETRDLAKDIRSRSKNKEIWDTTEARQGSEWEFLIPQERDLGDRHNTSCECDQKNRAD